METRKIIALLAVAVMAFSSLFVLASADPAEADDVPVKKLSELTGDDYWVHTTKVGNGYEMVQNTESGVKKCIVEVDAYTIVTGELTVPDGCGIIVDQGKTMDVGTIELNDSFLTVWGILPNKGSIELNEGTGAILTVKVGAQIDKDIVIGDCGLSFSNPDLVVGISPINGDAIFESPKDGSFDLIVHAADNEQWYEKTTYSGKGGKSLFLDYEAERIMANGNRSISDTIYLRPGTFCDVSCGETVSCQKNIRPINDGYVYVTNVKDGGNVAYKVDKDGKATVGAKLTLSGDVQFKNRYAFVGLGETIDLADAFGVSAMDGYKIAGWYQVTYDKYSRDIYAIDDINAFKCCENSVIFVTTEKLSDGHDYSNVYMLAFIVLVLAIIAPFAYMYVKDKY